MTQPSSLVNTQHIALAHQLADCAGEILRRYFRTALSVDNKADSSPVTQADREVEAALCALIEAAFPEHGIVGEEYGSLQPDALWQWVIDPIDGTRAFIAGAETFTTLIALCHNSVPLLGIIDQPITRERWDSTQKMRHSLNSHEANSKGIHLNATLDAPRIVQDDSGHDVLCKARLATTSTDYFTPRQREQFDVLRGRCARVQLGGDAYAYAMMANGALDIVVDAGMKPYDFCALRPVIEHAGGIITDWHGAPLTLASDGCVVAAANAALHQEALAILRANDR